MWLNESLLISPEVLYHEVMKKLKQSKPDRPLIPATMVETIAQKGKFFQIS